MSIFHTWGSAESERAADYPCDGLVEQPNGILFRAVDIDAPVDVVFRWLCQLRVAPYSYDWIDNWGRRSPRVRDPANERLAVGQPVMSIFRLVSFERDHQLTVVVARTRVFGNVAATYRVTSRPRGARLTVKIIFRAKAPMRWLLPAGDLIMMRKQLLTLKELAEGEAIGAASVRAPA